MPLGRVAYKQYRLAGRPCYFILRNAVPDAVIHPVLGGRDTAPLHDSTAQAVSETRAPAVRAERKDHHRSHGAPFYIEAMTLTLRPFGHAPPQPNLRSDGAGESRPSQWTRFFQGLWTHYVAPLRFYALSPPKFKGSTLHMLTLHTPILARQLRYSPKKQFSLAGFFGIVIIVVIIVDVPSACIHTDDFLL